MHCALVNTVFTMYPWLCGFVAGQEVSFAVAQPILQSALVVSGLLGIFVFGEISGALSSVH